MEDVIMNATCIKDNVVVLVKQKSKNIWKDVKTSEKYILHEDIELLY